MGDQECASVHKDVFLTQDSTAADDLTSDSDSDCSLMVCFSCCKIRV